MNTSNRLDAFMRAFFALICCASITGTSLHAASEDIQLGWATAPSGPFGPSEGSGDRANSMAIDASGAIILVGSHNPVGIAEPERFAALQLIPGAPGEVALGWATAPFEPFGPLTSDSADAVAVSASGSVILAGRSDDPNRFAALQLIPNMSGGVDLGWATALVEPFGPSDLDAAKAVAIDTSGNIILVGEHNPMGSAGFRFAALQLIPSGLSGITLGWATAIFEPFGPTLGDRASSVAIDANETIILAGFHNPSGPELPQFAALQLIPNMSGGVELGWATAISEPFGPSQLDIANDIVINEDGEIILGGFHTPSGPDPARFAALQLIPNMFGSNVTLGWVTAPIAPFGPSVDDRAAAITLDAQGNPVLAGFHRPVGALLRFAALQLLEIMPPLVTQLSLPFVPLAAA